MEAEICIQCLENYNAGRLVFKWVNIEDIEDFGETVEEFLKETRKKYKTQSEEYMIADYSDFPNLGEYPSFEEVQEVIDLMKQRPKDTEAIIIFIESGDNVENFEESYQGKFRDMTEFAEQLVDDIYDLDKMMGNLSSYFDYKSYANDLECGGDYYIIDGHVFRDL